MSPYHFQMTFWKCFQDKILSELRRDNIDALTEKILSGKYKLLVQFKSVIKNAKALVILAFIEEMKFDYMFCFVFC